MGRPVRSVFPLFCKICKKREDSDPPLAILSLLFLQIFFIGVFFITENAQYVKYWVLFSVCSVWFYSFLCGFQAKKKKKNWFFDFFYSFEYNILLHMKIILQHSVFIFYSYLMKFEKNLIDDCATHFLALGQKQTTVFSLKSHLALFWRFCRAKKLNLIEEITTQNIYEYLELLRKTPTQKTSRYYGKNKFLSEKTVQSKIISIKKFFKFLNFRHDIGLSYLKIEIPKVHLPQMEYLTKEELSKLFEHIEKNEKNEENRLRNLLFCKLAFISWMRLSELLSIKVKDILWESREISIVGKGDKIRPIYITKEIQNLASEYVKFRGERNIVSLRSGHTRKMQGDWSLLFIRHDDYGFGHWLSKSTIVWIMQKYSDQLNFGKRITCHMFRHSYATQLLNNWANIRVVQEMLGHSSIITTQRYTHITNNQLKEAHAKVFWGF